MNEPLKKPYPDFPLTPHPHGYWVKIVNGKRHRFGKRWCSAEDALADWLTSKDEIMAGESHVVESDYTLRDGLVLFMRSCKQKLESGQITQRTHDDYLAECQIIRDVIGASVPLASLKPHHFSKLMRTYKGSPSVIGNRVGRVRVAFRYLAQMGYMKQVNYGPEFKKPSQKTVRLARAAKPKKLFTPEDILTAIERARPQMKAMICLGLFAGFGNTDCATVQAGHFHGEWVEYHRPKTGVQRKAWLPEFARQYIDPVKPDTGRMFSTKQGNHWGGSGRSNPISAEFRKVCPVRLGFYSLRHTCETIGNRAKDPIAVCHVMGHLLPGMASVYNEEVDDERLKAVGEVIMKWLKPEL